MANKANYCIILQVPKFGATIDGFLFPYMGTFYYNSNNYILNNTNLKDYIKKQM